MGECEFFFDEFSNMKYLSEAQNAARKKHDCQYLCSTFELVLKGPPNHIALMSGCYLSQDYVHLVSLEDVTLLPELLLHLLFPCTGSVSGYYGDTCDKSDTTKLALVGHSFMFLISCQPKKKETGEVSS